MKKIASFVLILLCAITTKAQTNDFSPLQNRLKAHVYYLASDELRGRKGGSEDAAKAAEYIVDQYKQAGLKPLYSNFLVPFSPKNSMYKDMLGEETGAMVDDIMSGAMKDKRFRNVVAVIEGSDNTLKHEFIIIGAHYDHLGVKSDGVVYNGADDNASGTAAVIEVARELMQHPELLKRSVIIAAFDGEEMGLYGSNALANKLFDENDPDNIGHPLLYPAGKKPVVKMMMSIDMVGWLKQGKDLKLEGTGTLSHGKALAKEIAEKMNLPIDCKSVETSIFTATDTEPFARHEVPTLAVTTGLKSPYHKPEDDADLIDYPGLEKVTLYLADLTQALASRPEIEASGRLAPKHKGRQPLFQMGLDLGYNRMDVNFTDGALYTKSKLGWDGGVTAKFNLNHFAIQFGADYDRMRTLWPLCDSLSASLTQSKVVKTNYITIPLILMFQSSSIGGMQFQLGVGGYYGLALDSKAPFNEDVYGWNLLFGMQIGKWSLQIEPRYQINKQHFGLPQEIGKMGSVVCRLSRYFW